jgi:dinuclear metal center YbgI/SA1388 family protein
VIRVAQLKAIVKFLDEALDITGIDDSSVNGLQVGKEKNISRIGFAVDASLETFEKAKESFCDMLVVHHGLFWKKNETVTGIMYDRIKFLLHNNIALYAAHLPLDKHPELGNNAQLAKMLGFTEISPMGDIEMCGTFENEKSLESFALDIKSKLNTKVSVLPFGPSMIRRVAFCSGGGARHITEAIKEGCDTFVTGDSSHTIVHIAKEANVNVLFAGHYATETVGVKAVAMELKQRFDVEVGFIDLPTGL